MKSNICTDQGFPTVFFICIFYVATGLPGTKIAMILGKGKLFYGIDMIYKD